MVVQQPNVQAPFECFLPNTARLPAHPPMPGASMLWEVSWSRTHRWMRVRDPAKDESWLCKEMVGKARLLGADSDLGRLNLRCRAQQQGDCIYFYYPKEGPFPINPDEIEGQRFEVSHWRMCYHRALLKWRFWNERQGGLTLVKEYIGNISLNWLDHNPHIFHDGYWILDKDGVAHLIDPEV